jgi:hypothetical protein
MTKRNKLLAAMRHHPGGDFTIQDLKTLADHYGVAMRQPGTSHVTFSHPHHVEILTVPARRPIKAIYIKRFIAFLEELDHEKD